MTRFLYLVLAGLSLLANQAYCADPVGGIGDALGISPHLDWKTVESAHFRVSFPKELEILAKRSTKYLEEAHSILAPELQWQPKAKTQIVIVDNADSANGLTSAFQRFGIVLILTPPDNWFSTSYYDDWLRLLCIHEYTHFLNMDPTRGIYEPLRFLFGDVILPNSILPAWMLEGLAVYYETKFTQAGRGNGTYFEALTRTSVQANAFQKGEMTLDRITGPRPYFPGGETAYYYGWALTDQVGSKNPSLLGNLSTNSSYRIPFFINGNLENTSKELTGIETDWYKTWDEWVARITATSNQELAQLATQPFSKITPLTQSNYSALGARVSPNLQWLAYQEESLNENHAVWIRSLTHGTKRRLAEKVLGVGLSFSPDSKTLFWSEGRKGDLYTLWSNLKAYDTESNDSYYLYADAASLRARDPDVSPDGKQIVFSWTKDATTGIGLATLEKSTSNGHYTLKNPKVLFWPRPFGVASQPKWRPGGKQVVFSLHENGKNQEDLMEVSLSGEAHPLVSDGAYNRFASITSENDLYYVSNRTGIDTLFRFNGTHSLPVAHVSTALWLPSVVNSRTAYASILGVNGWDIAQVELKTEGLNQAQMTLPRLAPHASQSTSGEPKPTELSETKDYSIFPSIYPRQWAPLLFLGKDYSYLGGQVLGFDALDRHRYVFAGVYDTEVKRVDWLALYSNRSFGPTFTLLGYQTFAPLTAGSTTLENDLYLQFSASFPTAAVFSSFTPTFESRLQRTRYETNYAASTPGNVITEDDISHTLRFQYSSLDRPRLSLNSESGVLAEFGARAYQSNYQKPFVTKGYVSVEHPLTPFPEELPHWTLRPFARGAISSQVKSVFSPSNVQVTGRYRSVFGELTQDKLDRFRVRGYPGVRIDTQSAIAYGSELTFPIAWIYRGWGTNPLFIENLSGFAFGESVVFPQDAPLGQRSMPAAGGGVRLASTLFVRLPLVLALEVHHGFNANLGGTTEAIGRLDLGAIGF